MAIMKSKLITYNLNDRGRKHIGKERRFNIPATVALINSPRVQELVNSGDMYGYLGHGVREEWGIIPGEVELTGVGKDRDYVPIEPAVRTIHLKAHPDGTLEHMQEFLDNKLGRKALEWYEARVGGFSSVITPNMDNPTGFWGFDYVLVPNYAQNRGYDMVMDDAFDMERMTSRQKADWLHAREMERRVVLDSVRTRYQSLACDMLIADEVLANELAQKEQMAAIMDNLQFELQDVKHRLSVLDVKPEPMMKLSVGEDNWLNCGTPAVMDSINEFARQQDQLQTHGVDDWSPFDGV